RARGGGRHGDGRDHPEPGVARDRAALTGDRPCRPGGGAGGQVTGYPKSRAPVSTPSCARSHSLVARPPPKPPSPPAAITRWHGTTTGSGLLPMIAPTPRAAVYAMPS